VDDDALHVIAVLANARSGDDQCRIYHISDDRRVVWLKYYNSFNVILISNFSDL